MTEGMDFVSEDNELLVALRYLLEICLESHRLG